MADILDNETGKTLTVIDGGMSEDQSERIPKERKRHKLTAKQFEFARAILLGMTQSDAYRKAYDADGMSARAIHREASLLMHNPKIAQCIEEGRARQETGTLATAASFRDAIKFRLAEMAGISNPDGPHLCDNDRDRLAAMRMLGQLGDVKAFVDIPDTDTDREDADALMAELEDKLKRAFGK
jgi:hypothetical protein